MAQNQRVCSSNHEASRCPASITVGQCSCEPIGARGTSVASNYRSACRARSRAEFIAKIGVLEEEADESAFWLELVVAHKLMQETLVRPLLKEAEELTAIMAASRISASRNLRQSAIANRKSAML